MEGAGYLWKRKGCRQLPGAAVQDWGMGAVPGSGLVLGGSGGSQAAAAAGSGGAPHGLS